MVKGLVSGPDGGDLFVSAPGEALPVRAGGVLGLPVDPTGAPFGLVELVVWSGRGAGAVHRLEVGRYRCGPGEVDVPLPCPEAWTLDVCCGGVVVVDGDVWPVGERRSIGGLDLLVRWCAPPHADAASTRDLSLADLLLRCVSGLGTPPAPPSWVLGRATAAPLEVDIAENPLLTVVGPERDAVARGVLGRLLASCDPGQVRLTVLAPGPDRQVAERRARWSWVRWLPHARTGDTRVVRVGVDDDACARLVTEVAPGRPGLLDVVVVDSSVGDPPHLARPGLAVLVLDDGPAEAHAVGIVVDASGVASQVRGLQGAGPQGVEVDLPDRAWADRLARSLARPEPDRPAPGRLADLLGAEPDDLSVHEQRWARPTTTQVPIGWSRDGGAVVPVSVDLRADGPHALVGGTTGSGKSELLLTLVASLAAANPPEAMRFLLVDYKGGAAFGDCAQLPHTVGVVTDLDAGLTARALASLSAEVRRRERLLGDVGAADIDVYLAAGHGPLARLVIVVDEFATLAAELPDFVDGLVDIARRGRSLGLHLVLATQRPAGAVSADIRANTTLRISLRVAEAADSVDVLGVPDAVDIPESEPGRALVRVGQNRPVLVQTARVTTSAHESLTVPYVFGEPLPEAAGRSDLARMAEAMTVVASGRGVQPGGREWLPALPDRITLHEIEAVAQVPPPVDGVGDPRSRDVLPFGVEDRPSEQRRAVAELSLVDGAPLAVIGGARSGRTQTLLTLAASAEARYAPSELHVHALDAGARGLSTLEGRPNVGVVVHRDDPDRLARLVRRLGDELDRRTRGLATRGWRDVAEQHRVEPEDPWPFVLLLVDRWDLLTDTAEADDDRDSIVALERLAAEGGRVGIVVVATGDRGMLTGRMASVFPDRLVLRLSDVYDYASLGVAGPAGHGEPGRGWRGVDSVETQVADVVTPTSRVRPRWSPPGAQSGRAPAAAGGPFRIDPVPSLVTRSEVEAMAASVPRGGLVVAVGGDEVGPRWIDADEHGPCAVVTGRRRSGRSGVLLTLAESAVLSPEPWEVAVVTARRSPLLDLCADRSQVHGPFRTDEDAAGLRVVVERAVAQGRRLLVLADDVDLVPDGELLDELGRLPALLRDTGSLFVGSGEAEEIVAAFRGPAPALRRARCGVMLSPQGGEDGEAFGVRLRRAQYGRASGVGAGFLVLDGVVERVQVVRSGLWPDP